MCVASRDKMHDVMHDVMHDEMHFDVLIGTGEEGDRWIMHCMIRCMMRCIIRCFLMFRQGLGWRKTDA